MKKIFFILTAILCVLSAKAQQSDTLKGLAADTLVFYSVEHMPEFPGGMDQFYHYLATTIRYPLEARLNKQQGRVIIQMIVEKDGSLSHIKVIRGASRSLNEEAIRVISSCPKWNPGVQNGKSVRVMYSIPISFNLG
jgi:protein TonB